MKRNVIFAILLLTLFAILVPTTVFGCKTPPIYIEKEVFCSSYTNDPQNELFSINPPYYLGTKYYWWIQIDLTALKDLDHVEVFDRLGAEFMIEGICHDWPKDPNLPDGHWLKQPFDYTFDYSAGNPWPEQHEVITVRDQDGDAVATGHVDWRGVQFQGEFDSGDEDTFIIEWTGKSCKAHFQWIIGPMEENENKRIYIVISTDINPGGQQEFTSPGTHFLNSGATVKVYKLKQWRCWSMWVPFYSFTTDPLSIEVEEN